jgi:hypothetical protein
VADEVELTGRLVRGRVALGTKSERETLLIETDGGGATHVVRRRDAPTFGEDDPELAALVGRRVALAGSLVSGVLLVDAWQRLEGDAA